MKKTIMLKRWLVAISFIALFTVPSCTTGSPKGAEAPGFTLTDLGGRQVSLSSFRGQPVVINFWQLNCPPCIEELPYFQSVYTSGIKPAFLAVNIGDSSSLIKAFLLDNGYTFPVLIDGSGAVATSYGVRFTPTTFFIDSRGMVIDVKIGAFATAAELRQATDKLK